MKNIFIVFSSEEMWCCGNVKHTNKTFHLFQLVKDLHQVKVLKIKIGFTNVILTIVAMTYPKISPFLYNLKSPAVANVVKSPFQALHSINS